MDTTDMRLVLLLAGSFMLLGLVTAWICRCVRPRLRVVTTVLLLLTLCALIVFITGVQAVLQIELELAWRLIGSFLGAAIGFVVFGQGFHGKRIH